MGHPQPLLTARFGFVHLLLWAQSVVVLPYDASEDFKSLLTARFLVEHIMWRQQPLLAARFARL